MSNVVLQRVGDPPIEHANPAFAHQLLELVAQHSVDQAVEIVVMGKHHVAADVVGKSGAVSSAGRQTADVGVALVYGPIAVAKLLQPVRCTQTRRAGPDYRDSAHAHVGTLWRRWLLSTRNRDRPKPAQEFGPTTACAICTASLCPATPNANGKGGSDAGQEPTSCAQNGQGGCASIEPR